MKRNAEKISVEASNEESGLRVVEMPYNGNSATTLTLPSACHAQRTRPEIAVLGWNVRSYRLALRESKI